MVRQVYVKDHVHPVRLGSRKCVREVDLWMMKWVQFNTKKKQKNEQSKTKIVEQKNST